MTEPTLPIRRIRDQAPPEPSACCPPEAQATCCAPSDKAACCTPTGPKAEPTGCGCR